MENLEYEELKIQSYFHLDGIKAETMRNMFRFRTRMTPYGENFRNGSESVVCPLCGTHEDSQTWATKCPAMRNETTDNYDLEKCYEEDMTTEAANQMDHVMNIRKMLLNRKQADD